MSILRKAGQFLWHLIVFAAAVAVAGPWFLLAIFLIVGCVGFVLAGFGVAHSTINSFLAVFSAVMVIGFIAYMYIETKDQ